MSSNQQPYQSQADPKLALQYLGEVAQTYSTTLNPVEKAPFINQVNNCLKVLAEDRRVLVDGLRKAEEELAAALATPSAENEE